MMIEISSCPKFPLSEMEKGVGRYLYSCHNRYLPTYLPTYTLPVSPPCDVWSPRAGYDTHTLTPPTHISNSSMYLHVGE